MTNNCKKQLEELLSLTVKEAASDLHLSVGHSPVLRLADRLVPLLKKPKLSPEDTRGLAEALMTQEQLQRFLQEKEVDFSYSFQERARFRVNVFFQAEDGIRDLTVTGVQTCALPISLNRALS